MSKTSSVSKTEIQYNINQYDSGVSTMNEIRRRFRVHDEQDTDHKEWDFIFKVGCVVPMVIVSILPDAKFGRNYHREDASHFIFTVCKTLNSNLLNHLL